MACLIPTVYVWRGDSGEEALSSARDYSGTGLQVAHGLSFDMTERAVSMSIKNKWQEQRTQHWGQELLEQGNCHSFLRMAGPWTSSTDLRVVAAQSWLRGV